MVRKLLPIAQQPENMYVLEPSWKRNPNGQNKAKLEDMFYTRSTFQYPCAEAQCEDLLVKQFLHQALKRAVKHHAQQGAEDQSLM